MDAGCADCVSELGAASASSVEGSTITSRLSLGLRGPSAALRRTRFGLDGCGPSGDAGREGVLPDRSVAGSGAVSAALCSLPSAQSSSVLCATAPNIARSSRYVLSWLRRTYAKAQRVGRGADKGVEEGRALAGT